MVDYIGIVLMNGPQWNSLSAETYTLAVGVNLCTISENCDINKRRSPLLPSPKNLRTAPPPPPTLWSRISAVSFSPTGRASSTLVRASTLGASRFSRMAPSSATARC
ncbi:hypothetical protein Cob_v003008 [Colletotrichum orbiculare MAFF 240422]|uniref:Uncharacterized protein n=1 Tax=Colletotrichum orbiculare (strain 104-T / ATCC 96160 / CBS 514.97 / LARS 414 / MAFF 240422) TaxID=1213857 RepID=A0A484G0F6_COLOR|nr:hypothetical protein Cob_v003008 [Colletotrichum orbiculare MAFF 240422]